MHMILYHGSTIPGITELRAMNGANIFLTPNRAYSLFYIRDLEINHVTCGVTSDGFVRYDEQFPNQLMKLYKDISGYLYQCNENSDLAVTGTNDIWVSKLPVAVDKVEYIQDAYEEILKYEVSGDVKVVRYETLSDEQKKRYYDMAVQYIYKMDLLHIESKKSTFWKESFPEAWSYVQKHFIS